jgi:hypothetical protein
MGRGRRPQVPRHCHQIQERRNLLHIALQVQQNAGDYLVKIFRMIICRSIYIILVMNLDGEIFP